jgi:hypothetical protein
VIENRVELRGLIRALSDQKAVSREAAAAEIFARGCALARPAVEQWLGDEELARHLVDGASDVPEQTVGVAVEPATFEQIRSAFGSPPLAGVPPDQDAREFEIECAKSVRLDILTTRAPGGPGALARFLEKFGEGIQQVEIVVNGIDRATELLREQFGIAPVFPATRPGAGNTRMNFFLVAVPGGKVLIELVEKAAPHRL